MTKKRRKQLEKNFRRMFWIRAFLNTKVINVVIALFYIHRGLTVSQILYVSMVWATASLIFEIPSSYLADRWGRKKTIILGIIFACIQWNIFIFAHGFFWMGVGILFMGLSYASLSGTDEALVYDTERELGQEHDSLSRLGKYRASHSIFKIITPIIGVLIAKDLTDSQFISLLLIDVLGTIVAFIVALRIVEPDHKMDVEKTEAGVIKDGWKLLINDKELLRALLNKEILFFALFMLWSYYQKFFVDLGISIVFIGFAWSFSHLAKFIWYWYVGHFHTKYPVGLRIDRLNYLYTVFALFFVVFMFVWPQPYILLLLYILLTLVEAFRFPLFSELFHKRFHSYNRATTMSLSNLLHNVLEYPILFAAALLVAKDMRYPYIFSFFLSLIVLLFLQLHRLEKKTKSNA